MKKLALLLGSLLLVGATAQAKEVIAAPVEVSKEVMAEPVVEEVVVVETPTFRPSGYTALTLRYYGETEGCNDDMGTSESDSSHSFWNRGANNRSRLQTLVGVQITEKSYLALRFRTFKSWETENSRDASSGSLSGTESRIQYYYDHNDEFTSRLQYRQFTSDSYSFEYKLIYNLYKNEGGLLSSITLDPHIYHSQASNNSDDYYTALGLDINYAGDLPYGIGYSGTLYLDQNYYNLDQKSGKDSSYDEAFNAYLELYVWKSFGLYSTENLTVDFDMVGGYDGYSFNEYDSYTAATPDKTVVTTPAGGIPTTETIKGTKAITNEKTSYSLYADLGVSAKYTVTPSISLNGGVGAEYRNWDITGNSDASNWRWQPYATVGMRATF